MIEFHDKRDQRHIPRAEDYDKELTRASLIEANKRFRQTGVPRVISSDKEKAATIVKIAARNRRKGINTGQNVGEYLEFLNELARQED